MWTTFHQILCVFPIVLYNLNMVATSPNDTLIFAHVLFRHGARNIASTYPNDPYKNESYWPEGFGQLTMEGKLQHYNFGLYLKRRYAHLIDETYSLDDIYILSTDFDRTIMSVQTGLAGLYPPDAEEKIVPHIDWQPVPVHTVPLTSDRVLSTGLQCPRYEFNHLEYIRNDSEMVRIRNENVDLYDQWLTDSGLDRNLEFFGVVHLLYNILSIEKEQAKPIPKWAEDALQPNSPMEYIAKMNFQSYSATRQLARLKQGFLIKEIMERFEQKINGALEPDRKLWLYSAHDLTIGSVLNALKLFELHFPPYAASVHFELFRTDAGEHYFQIFYRQNGEEKPEAMNIPGCGTQCSIEQFYDLFSDIIPGTFELECQMAGGYMPSTDNRIKYLDLL